MSKRDYYSVLGVARGASEEEIRRAYRSLARKLHPDVNKAPDAQARFTEVQEAYDTLSDPQKRAAYDRFGGEPPPGWTGSPGTPRPTSVHQDLDLDDLGSMFDAFFGGGASSGLGGFGRAKKRSTTRATEALHHEVTIPFETAIRGGLHQVRIETDSVARTIEVSIPRGTEDGAKLRVKSPIARPGSPGTDLILTIRVSPHPLYRRGEGESAGRGLDLYLELPLTLAEATLGAEVTIPTPEGPVQLTVPEGTSSGRMLRLRGRGITDSAGRKGDFYAVARIVPPDPGSLSDTERAALRSMSSRVPHPRSGPTWEVPSADTGANSRHRRDEER